MGKVLQFRPHKESDNNLIAFKTTIDQLQEDKAFRFNADFINFLMIGWGLKEKSRKIIMEWIYNTCEMAYKKGKIS